MTTLLPDWDTQRSLPMTSREPTYEQLLVLAKHSLECGCYGQGVKRICPADVKAAESIVLVVSEDGADWLFRNYDRLPVTEQMGS